MAHSDSSARGPFSTRGASTVVAILLFLTAAAAIQLARAVPTAEAVTVSQQPTNPPTLEGFRADAWFLPEDAMLGFVSVPGGPFLMGSDRSIDPMAFDNEIWSPTQPRGTVDIPEFYIGRYEVTVAQFRAFVDDTDYAADPQSLRAPPDHPVSFVSWPDALAYARWLDSTLRDWPGTPAALKALLDDGWRITLPTEAEWEKAARGGDGRIYSWGNVPRRDRANYASGSTTPVGSFDCPDCAFGLADMSGNVWEWTRSPYQPLPYDPSDDRDDLASDALWVMRGGSYQDTEQNIRAGVRGGADPGVHRAFIGFRLVVSPPEVPVDGPAS